MPDAPSVFADYQPEPHSRPDAAEPTLAEATAADVAGLAELQTSARGGLVAEWAARIGRAVGRERNAVVVARVGQELAGYATAAHLAEHPDDHAPAGYYLVGVTVATGWRRRGIGTALTRWRMDWAWQHDPDVWCFVSAANPASIDMHLELGFTELRRGPQFQGITFSGQEGVLLRARRSA
ncbi:GNAT superfamily N-acetyltransferase [Kitasatospora sp. GP30]|uniref:GNAT family N-acetyltransferase n=1 Tax=Kitasatospora sp. GP30 TaxID=3035084 RepID=UPI000C6FFAA3|nr:GNAT family N-acetyltransferase [Kitasatospora sp. GP30]MDH6141815.1 GNAT superfamily N-acetyltransferase [Kitasatospora sp. GP30]